jgi:hypothetical protein
VADGGPTRVPAIDGLATPPRLGPGDYLTVEAWGGGGGGAYQRQVDAPDVIDWIDRNDRYDQFGHRQVQYVVGAPPQMPVLRPLRQSLYSRMWARPGTTRAMGFSHAMGQMNEIGMYTTAADTNMTQAGQLGYPLEYDLVSVGIHPSGAGAEYKEKWDTFLNHRPEFIWIFGGNTHWIRTTINLMEMKFPFMTERQYNDARGRNNDFPEVLAALSRDTVLPRIVNMTTPDRRARRISSTESFRAEVNFVEMAWAGGYDFSWYAAMHGILYAQL